MADPWLGDGTVSYLRKGVPLGKDERKAAPRVLTYRLPLATAAGGRVGGGGATSVKYKRGRWVRSEQPNFC